MQLHTNEITFEHHGAVTLLDIQGDITSFSEPFLNEAYQNANDQGAGKILLKIGTDAYINSGGIAVLIQILSQTKQNNQKIGIAKFAEIHDTVESAIQTMAWKKSIRFQF